MIEVSRQKPCPTIRKGQGFCLNMRAEKLAAAWQKTLDGATPEPA